MSSADIKLTSEDAACPFCGAGGEEAFCVVDDSEWAVSCSRCGAVGPPMKDPADAIDEWNHRSEANAAFQPEPP